jgi:hypothetical protein
VYHGLAGFAENQLQVLRLVCHPDGHATDVLYGLLAK